VPGSVEGIGPVINKNKTASLTRASQTHASMTLQHDILVQRTDGGLLSLKNLKQTQDKVRSRPFVFPYTNTGNTNTGMEIRIQEIRIDQWKYEYRKYE
jgi:hypothetical protein